jgi:BolA family transcriptional regulator, general stress-responsive regulator
VSVIARMRERLQTTLQAEQIEIGDDSALHAGHAGARSGGGHYRLDIVSPLFAGQRTVARHRMIYDALGEMMRGEIHALVIRARTAEEAAIQPTGKETQ